MPFGSNSQIGELLAGQEERQEDNFLDLQDENLGVIVESDNQNSDKKDDDANFNRGQLSDGLKPDEKQATKGSDLDIPAVVLPSEAPRQDAGKEKSLEVESSLDSAAQKDAQSVVV